MSASVRRVQNSVENIELTDLLRAAKAGAKGGNAKRRPTKRTIAKSEAAGGAIVAALLGSQIIEHAEAAEDIFGGRDVRSWIANVRICGGHVFHSSSVRSGGGVRDAVSTRTFADHSGHLGLQSRAAAGLDLADHDAHLSSVGISGGGGRGEHGFHAFGGRFQRFGRGSAKEDAALDDDSDQAAAHDGHTDGTATGVDAGTDVSDGDHTHTDTTSGSTSTDATSGGVTGSTDTTDDHTHTTTDTTTGSTDTSGATGGVAAPAPGGMSPAMHAEHMAILNLVPVSAATHVAVNNGSWFDPNTWANGQVPGDGAKVLIPQGITVDYDGESAVSLFTVRVDGQLDFATDIDTFMEVDTFVVTNTGKLTIGTEANPVDPNVHAVIQFADNGAIDVAWDPMLFSRGLISQGSVDIHGAEKDTFLKVAIDPMKGDTALTLETVPNGWQVGDKIVLTGTHLASIGSTPKDAPITTPTQDEELIITAINGNVVTFDRPLAFDHEGARSDLKAYVANYSRNIVFESEGGDALPSSERGHVMFHMSDDVTVKYAEFTDLGRTDKSVTSFDVATLSQVDPDSNIRGRYSLHLHHTGVSDPAHPTIIEGNAVWGSPGWGFVQHDSNALLSNNAAYDVFGAAFVAETGNEIGAWTHNIAIKSLGINHLTKTGADVNIFDLGRTGTGFWFQGRLVDAVDNVAAGVPSGAGFTYFHRGLDSFHIPIDPSNSPVSDSLRYLDSVRSNTPTISIFSGNESFATETGLEIIKANPQQDSDLRSVISDFLAWEVKTGAHLEYTGHYTLKGLDFVATDSPWIKNAGTIGLELGKNVFDVVVNGADIDGFATGVRQIKIAVGRQFDFMNTSDQWDYIYIDVNVSGATTDFTNPTASDKFLTAADLTDGRLFYNSAFPETFIQQANNVYDLLGTKTDSIGQTAGYKPWDPDIINSKELRGSIEQNGYWTTTDGRRVALIEEYYADRATGDVIKVGIFVEIPSTAKLFAGGFTRIDPAYNGVLNQNSLAPTAQDDFAQVKQGHSVVIDLLANDSDPDGDAIKVDGIFSDHGHVVDNGDGTVTYFADSSFSGDDTFYYFVQDTNGDITKAQVTVTVDI